MATTEQEADRLNELLAELRRRLALGFSHVGEAAIVDAGSARERATKVIVGQRALPADAVILAGGAWSGAPADALGVSLPVAPQRGQIPRIWRFQAWPPAAGRSSCTSGSSSGCMRVPASDGSTPPSRAAARR